MSESTPALHRSDSVTILVDPQTGEIVDAVHPAANLFPLLDEAALEELADDIATNGLREPVWLYQDPELGTVLLDGRNRVRACELAGVPVETRRYAGDDPVGFVVSANVHRRHLTTAQRAAVALDSLPLYAAEAAKRKAQAASIGGKTAGRGRPKADDSLGADLHQGNDPKTKRAPRSADKAAKVAGTSGRTVAQLKRVREQAPDLAVKVETGGMSLDRAERIIRDRDAEQRRIRQAKAEAATAPSKPTVDIRHGDFRQVLDDLEDVDAIITDPPYPHEYLPLLDDLAAWADKVLAPDGVLAVLIGQTHLPEVYRRLDGHRPYRWTGCYLTEGPGYVSHPRRVQSSWKPLLVYGGGPRISDVVRSSGDDKRHHRWGQNYDAFYSIVERLTSKGQTVVDPFAGGGTTLLAAHALGRHAIGSDVDLDAVQTARERFA